MTIPTLIMSLLTAAALFVSIFALAAARRTSDRSLSKRLSELSTQLEDVIATQETQAVAIKNLRSRITMGALRDRKRTEPAGDSDGAGSSPGESAEAAADRWQREMNYKIATGQVRVGPTRR